jgi:hypothetical protein
MNLYTKRFTKVIKEQDELEDVEMTDQEAMADTLEPETDPADFDVDAPGSDSISSKQKEMYDELNSWVNKMDEFSNYLNGTENSIQTSLNSAEPDTIFDSISNAETKKIARVAMEISSLSEILKGYLAGANDPKYKYN